jgi:hypothetical protein
VRPRFRCPYWVVSVGVDLSSIVPQGGLYSISLNGRWFISLVRVDVDAIEDTILDITASVACDQLTRHIGNGSRRKRNQARVDLLTIQ